MKPTQFFCYITTNPTKTVLYVGATNNLPQRLTEHYLNRGAKSTFAGRYNCHCLLYFEVFNKVSEAFAREKQIKGWTRKKKGELITLENCAWKFLNSEIMEWPPGKDATKRVD